jgi:cytochrome c oxidase assembly factor CtaG
VTVSLDSDPGAPPSVPQRRGPWFEIVCAVLGLAVAAVAGVALYRSLTAPHTPVLPLSWCGSGSPRTLPPLLGTALLTQWHRDAIALVVIAVALALYLAGVATLRRTGRPWPASRTGCFAAGLAVCVLATNASIAVYDMALFSAHMIGHLMLVMLAPALLCLGRPLDLLVQAPAEPWRTRMTRLVRSRPVSVLLSPPVALASYTAVIVCSHLTGLMDVTMQHPWAAQVEHLVYLLVGIQFFTLLAGADSVRWQLTTPARWLLLAISMAVDTFTGVVLMTTTQPVAMVAVPGLPVDPLSDTHTGGAIMWVGGDGLMAAVMIGLTIAFLRRPEMHVRDRTGWVEQVRQAVFAGHVGSQAGPADAEFDEEEANRERYNRWLARLNERAEEAANRTRR